VAAPNLAIAITTFAASAVTTAVRCSEPVLEADVGALSADTTRGLSQCASPACQGSVVST
jgi:hypothetical protein